MTDKYFCRDVLGHKQVCFLAKIQCDLCCPFALIVMFDFNLKSLSKSKLVCGGSSVCYKIAHRAKSRRHISVPE